MMIKAFSLAIALFFAPASAGAQTRWLGSWAAAPAQPQPSSPDALKRGLAAPGLENQTIVQVVRLSAGGARLRLRLTNEYGDRPLAIGAATVALTARSGAILGAQKIVRFAGQTSATIPPGAPLISDPVDLPTAALADVRIALYLPGSRPPCTCHMTGQASIELSPPGDYTQRVFESPPGPKPVYRAFLAGVEVSGGPARGVVVAFGDSITDGFKSTPDTNRRWPDLLADRLIARVGPGAPAVVNEAISGNRLIFDGYVESFGQSGLARFDRDVLSIPGATHLIVLEGINDIGISRLGASRRSPPPAEAIIAGYRQLIARAHAHKLKVIFGTLLPYEGASYFESEGEAVRQAVNTWLRSSADFDGLVDFDTAMRDPAHPSRLRADLQSGDWLHPNDAGYKAMANAVNLALLR